MAMRHIGSTALVAGLALVAPARAENAVPADGPAPAAVANAFQRQVFLPLRGGESSAGFVAPEGKRLVIEYVSASAEVPFGQFLLVALETSVDGETATHFLAPGRPDRTRVTATDGDVVRLRQWMRAYADGGTEVKVRVNRTGHWGGGSAWVTVSGYLVPRAQPRPPDRGGAADPEPRHRR